MPRHNTKQAHRSQKKEIASGNRKYGLDQMNAALDVIAGPNFRQNHIVLDHDPDKEARLEQLTSRDVPVQTILLVGRRELARLQAENQSHNQAGVDRRPCTKCTAREYPVIQVQDGIASEKTLYITIKSEFDPGAAGYVFSHLDSTQSDEPKP